jgi:hypothetical protein
MSQFGSFESMSYSSGDSSLDEPFSKLISVAGRILPGVVTSIFQWMRQPYPFDAG